MFYYLPFCRPGNNHPLPCKNNPSPAHFYSILLFFQLLTTFAVFGGPSVLTNMLPKIGSNANKANYIFTYWLLSFPLTLICMLALIHFGDYSTNIKALLQSQSAAIYLLLLAPVYVTAQVFLNSLPGLLKFKTSAIMTHFQLFVVVAILGWLTLFSANQLPLDLLNVLLPAMLVIHLVASLIIVSAVVVAVGLPTHSVGDKGRTLVQLNQPLKDLLAHRQSGEHRLCVLSLPLEPFDNFRVILVFHIPVGIIDLDPPMCVCDILDFCDWGRGTGRGFGCCAPCNFLA